MSTHIFRLPLVRVFRLVFQQLFFFFFLGMGKNPKKILKEKKANGARKKGS